MARLKRVDCSQPGISRRRRGRGFEYLEADGSRVTLGGGARANPRARDPAGLDRRLDLQAPERPPPGDRDRCRRAASSTCTTAAWRTRRDQQKFDEMLDFARALPRLRKVIRKDLAAGELDRRQVLACALRLLDRGFFRIGSEDYAEQNDSYGLATILKSHVSLVPGAVRFDYVAKSGQRRIQEIDDQDVVRIVTALKRRRGGGEELLAYRKGAGGSTSPRRTSTSTSRKRRAAISPRRTSAPGTGPCSPPWRSRSTRTKREAVRPTKRAITEAVKVVAGFLGNTPAVARASYIDPRVFDRYLSGWTIAPALEESDDAYGLGRESSRRVIEEAVVDLIEEPRASDDVAKVA